MVPATRFELARIAPVEIVEEQLKSTALNHSATPVEMYNIEAEVPAIIIYAVSTFRDEAYTVVAVQM